MKRCSLDARSGTTTGIFPSLELEGRIGSRIPQPLQPAGYDFNEGVGADPVAVDIIRASGYGRNNVAKRTTPVLVST